jgi:hypothetical protein
LQPEPEAGRVMKRVANQNDQSEYGPDFHHEHHRILDHQTWIEFPERINRSSAKNLAIP